MTTLATAQVCQRWRSVALDYPVIWSRIINYEQHSPLWIETLLVRSGSTLIDVYRNSPFEPIIIPRQCPRQHKPVLQSIFQRIASLKTISLCIPRDTWESICRSSLGQPAPNLEFLKLIIYCPFSAGYCYYPNPLFADEAPSLRRLHLENCLIDFSSSVLSNLTELSVLNVIPRGVLMLSEPEYSHRLRLLVPSVAGWLRVLKNIPALRFLTLWDAISHPRATYHEPLLVVDLPHLALLTINTEFHLGVSLIDHLNIPLCGIKFKFTGNRSRSTDGLDGHKLLSFLLNNLHIGRKIALNVICKQ